MRNFMTSSAPIATAHMATNFDTKGFLCVEDIHTPDEVNQLIYLINKADQSKPTFRRSNDLFAVRQFLKEVPEVSAIVFNTSLRRLINQLFGPGYFVTKSIYFDKPGKSNWFVAYHQDLTISVDRKADLPGFGPWTVKHNQFAVQPPLAILQNNFTIRIHLDDTTADNGALKVLVGSHRQGILRLENLNLTEAPEQVCEVKSGGVMLMHPLIFHASDRTVNDHQRRVIHIEFSKAELPSGINWSEKQLID